MIRPIPAPPWPPTSAARCVRPPRPRQDRCGLPLATYFSAIKLRWLLDHPTPALTDALANKRARFGTVDSWLLWVCVPFTIRQPCGLC